MAAKGRRKGVLFACNYYMVVLVSFGRFSVVFFSFFFFFFFFFLGGEARGRGEVVWGWASYLTSRSGST